MIVIVAGVSGSGKTTVGAMLAGHLHWRFADGDDFHPAANIEKMRAGIPLTDADRWPWLGSIAAWMDERIAQGESAVIPCSALKRSYRDILLKGRPEAQLIFLAVDPEVLAQRLAARHGHFFHVQLLGSQLDALEPPQPGEHTVTVVEHRADQPADTVAAIIGLLSPDDDAGPAAPDDNSEAGTQRSLRSRADYPAGTTVYEPGQEPRAALVVRGLLSNPAGIHNQEWGGHVCLCTGPALPSAQIWPLLRHYS